MLRGRAWIQLRLDRLSITMDMLPSRVAFASDLGIVVDVAEADTLMARTTVLIEGPEQTEFFSPVHGALLVPLYGHSRIFTRRRTRTPVLTLQGELHNWVDSHQPFPSPCLLIPPGMNIAIAAERGCVVGMVLFGFRFLADDCVVEEAPDVAPPLRWGWPSFSRPRRLSLHCAYFERRLFRAALSPTERLTIAELRELDIEIDRRFGELVGPT